MADKRVAIYLSENNWNLITTGLDELAKVLDSMGVVSVAEDAGMLSKHITTELVTLKQTGKDENLS